MSILCSLTFTHPQLHIVLHNTTKHVFSIVYVRVYFFPRIPLYWYTFTTWGCVVHWHT